MPENHQYRERALKLIHPVRTPDFYIQYGALQEAARATEIARAMKHHREALPKMEAALKLATDRYLAAFNAEIKLLSHDRLLADEPEVNRQPTGSGLQIEVRCGPASASANYWPSGPLDIPSLSRAESLKWSKGLHDTDRHLVTDVNIWCSLILERHLRIRAAELQATAVTRPAREALRAAKHFLDGYPESAPVEASATLTINATWDQRRACVLAYAAHIIKMALDSGMGEGSYKEQCLAVSQGLRDSADHIARRNRLQLFGNQEAIDRAEPLVIRCAE